MSVAPNDARSGSDLERQALAALRRMRERLDAVESARHEPLAIVGAACRLPGAPDIDAFWDLLRRGGDAIVDVPAERWDDRAWRAQGPELVVPRQAGLLARIDGFDAEFFGITDREAQSMDPQQRIFLEVAWEALERAGIPPHGLKGSATGVFVGTTTSDYLQLLDQRLPAERIDAYVVSGNTLNATAGRVSYTFGLRGPAMAIDTACSSSLVAFDRACRSVRDGESRMAIAGGVNLVLMPQLLVSMARWGMLAPDARCKTFDAAADGFVRAEGCGVVLIKRLSDAQADGDRIWALVRGSAVNQAGASGAFAVPNGLAQAEVLRAALAAARVEPGLVGFVEAHGTGTSLGDPIEMEAIVAAYGAGRDPARPLWVGAVKSNVGHLEAAAGIAGLLKAVLALRHRQIPPNVHFHRPTPHIPWERIPVRVPTRVEPFPAVDGRRLAAVSAFGFSGTNAHVVLEEAPAARNTSPLRAPALLLTLSARHPDALAQLARRHARQLDGTGADADAASRHVLASAAARSHHALRMAVGGRDAAELAQRLRLAADAGEAPLPAGVARGRVGVDRPRVAFLFTGQGAQYAGMGRQLAQASPVFRAAVERCAAVIDPLLGRALLPLMFGESDDPEALARTGCTQPALFALQYALVEWWRSMGVEPAVVLGHSVGEFAAACCAGVLTMEEAATLVCARGSMMQALPEGGAMAAVFAAEHEVRQRMSTLSGVIAIAGLNGPDETVVSGDAAAVAALAASFESAGVRTERLAVSHAFHSPLMQPMLARFGEAAGHLAPAAARCTVVSSLSGRIAAADWAAGPYWQAQVSAPVRWHEAAQTALAQGVGIALEIGPQPVLAGLGRRTLPDAGIAWLASLRRGQDDATMVMAALGELYVRGAVDDWSGAGGAVSRSAVDLPVYPFQPTRHWIDVPAAEPSRHDEADWVHPLLARMIPLARGDVLFETRAGDARHGWLREHRIGGRSVWPAAASLEALLAAAAACGFDAAPTLRDVEFIGPLVLPDTGHAAVQLILTPQGTGESRAEMYAAPPQPGECATPFVRGRIVAAERSASEPTEDMAVWIARCVETIDAGLFHARLAAAGADFGPAFRRLGELRRGSGEAMARMALSAPPGAAWRLHPSLLDAGLQLVSAAAAAPDGTDDGLLWVPVRVEAMRSHRVAGASLIGHAQLRGAPAGNGTLVADVSFVAPDGTPVATLSGVHFTRLRAADLVDSPQDLVDRCGLTFAWQQLEAPSTATAVGRWRLLGSDNAAVALARALRSRGRQIEGDAGSLAPPDHLVLLDALALPQETMPEAGLAALQPAFEAALASLAAARSGGSPARLWWVTRGAQRVCGADRPEPLAAALWGLGRVARAEHPDLQVTLVDLGADSSFDDLAALLCAAPVRESQLALRDGVAWCARLQPLPAPQPWHLAPPTSGRIEDLHPAPRAPRSPAPDEVRIDVRAAGLNFRDVLSTLGMVASPVDTLGGECAGRIAAVGANVTDFAVGDEVMALAFGALASSVCVPRHFVVPRPAGLNPLQAAALPIACLTASLGLEELAGLQRGQRILIHAATGGVGMAALQLAKALGAEVCATAGNDTKRALLRRMGVAHVFDSRSLSFADDVREATGGAGVHVVLNALSGDFIPAGLSLLEPGGCFLEMGKRGIWSEADVARRHPGLRYHAFDLGEAAQRDPALVPRLFARLLARLRDGTLSPLPLEAMPMRDAALAFQTMAQARHVGKLVLARDPASPGIPVALHADACYLVSGGLGALGLEVAQALAARGARHLWLVGRSAPSPQAHAVIEQLRQRGVSVTPVPLDVSDGAALRALVCGASAGPALRGIVHAAGVLDDAVLERTDWSRAERVLRPKLEGARQLAAATQDCALDFFVLFSAGAGWLGSAGQGAYAAANAALDAFAESLRARGRQVTAIAWGRWRGAGMASSAGDAHPPDWEAMGIGEIAPTAGVTAMFTLVERQAASVAVMPIDWPRHLRHAHGTRAPACFDTLLPGTPAAGIEASISALAQLKALAPALRHDAVRALVEAQVRSVAGIGSARVIDADRPLRDLGMDSLMSVELRNALGAVFGRSLTATLLFDHPTLNALSLHLMSVVPELGDTPVAAATADAAHDAVRSLSDDEAEAELLAELAKGAAR